MVRRISALIGIILLVVILVLLVWTVHMHRVDTMRGTEPAEQAFATFPQSLSLPPINREGVAA